MTRRLASRLTVLLVFAGVCFSAARAEPFSSSETPEKARDAVNWVGFSTPHFELYTTNDEQTAYDAVQRFERLYEFFGEPGVQGGLLRTIPESKVRVIAFRSAREFSSHQISPSACAYYQRTQSGDYIVMQDLSSDHYQVGVHEYAHFLIRAAGLKLPLWLNEGLAEFYSSLESGNGRMFIGRPPYGRLHSLRSQTWIKPRTLFVVERSSPYYTQPDKMSIFYAESWALTHMLAMQAVYAAQFPRLLAAISNGASTLEALQLIYHKNPDQLISDLNEYLQQPQLPTQATNLSDSNTASRLEPQSVASSAANVDFALADLAAANPYAGSGAAGQSQLVAVSRKYPDNPAAEESLGYLALTQNRPAEARIHFAKAVERHSTKPDALFYSAHLDLEAGAPLPPVIELLQRVLALNPAHYNARFDLGFAAAKTDRFELALSVLDNMPDVLPEHQYLLAYTLAYCYIHLNRTSDAQLFAKKAERLVNTTADRLQTENLLKYIEYQSGRDQPVQNQHFSAAIR